MTTSKTFKRSLLAAVSTALLFASAPASAYSDGLERIGVTQQALDTEDVNRLRIWVQLASQAQVMEAKTLVRVQPAGKGTGLVEPTRDVLAERIREAIAAQSRDMVAVAFAQ